MSAAPTVSGPPGGTLSGWLVARADGRIVAADAQFAALLGAPAAAALVGRNWPSLVTARTEHRLREAQDAVAAGERWSGTLELIFAHQPVELRCELVAPAGTEDLVILRATEAAHPSVLPIAGVPEVDAAGDLPAYVAALEAAQELRDSAAAGRSVLQAVHSRLPYDWGALLLLEGEQATVVCAYPSAMAGVEADLSWSPLDAAERTTVASGEPSLTGELAVAAGDGSPLARLPAFGMRSALRVPLFRGGRVRGCVSLYAARRNAFSSAEGVRLHRLVRPLGVRLRDSSESAAPPRAGAALDAQPAPPPPQEAAPETPPAPEAPSPAEPAPPAPPQVSPARPAASPEEQFERLSALGEVVSGVAHELNNPLTAILGYAQMLPTLQGEERERACTTIEQEALRASRIVRNLLSFGRQHQPRVEPVDINAVVRRVVELRNYSLSVDNVEVEMHLGDTPLLLVDEYQMEQVFLNLVNNAHQAMQREGGTLTLSTAVSGSTVRVTVSDTGPGIPEDVAPRIFEPFFTTREVGRGTGMGLAIVYGLVAEHGGRVWVERSPSGGAQFVVELPQPEMPLDVASVAQPAEAPAGRGERVLVVDDEEPVRVLTREILEMSGYRADAATSGEEALGMIERESYALLVVDIRMPGMDGVDLYHRVGERWPDLQRRVIFISGDPEGERSAALLRQQDVHYLEKPFDTGDLLRAVRRRLDED